MKSIKYTIALLAATVLIGACANKEQEPIRQQESASEESGMLPNDSSINLPNEEGDESVSVVSVRGYIDVPPENKASISPYYAGYVSRINVLPGAQIKKGEVLFSLQNPEYLDMQEQYLEAVGQLAYLKEDYERQKLLADEKIASQKNFRKAESDYKVMSARAKALKEQLQLMGISPTRVEEGRLTNTILIKAPLGGSITSVSIQKGIFVDTKDVAMEIVNTEHLHLELEVFEREALKITEGQDIRFSIPEMGQKIYKGKVHLVVPAIDMKKRTFLVHGHIEEEKTENFLPGMYVDAEIVIK